MPYVYLVTSAVFHYLGPAFAVLLFARVDVLGVAWLRIAAAALVLGLWRRPKIRRDQLGLVLAWGAVLALMNCCFYLALDRLPLATVASIEFLPVVALAALGARTPRNAVALAFAVVGVVCVTGFTIAGDDVLGLVFAVANAAGFAAYIVLGHRVAADEGIDGLALAMVVAFVVVTPFAAWAAVPAFTDPVVLAAGIAVGVCSSVIPYVSDQLAMALVPRATYALMVALLPATAVIIGVVVLSQVPTTREALGVALVVAGVGLHQRSSATSARSSKPRVLGGASPSTSTAPPGQYG
ncbi:MAG TPA: EamA family transporter [Solirubrobacteraceae bacterium]